MFCTYCGTQILISDDSVTKQYIINEAKIKKVEAEERLANRRLDIEEANHRRKWIIILVYVGVCVAMGLSTYVSYRMEAGKTSRILLFVTVLLVTLPIMVLITRMILKYTETTVETSTETKWFGLVKNTSTEVTTPTKRVLLCWIIYLFIIFYVFLFAVLI